MLDLPVFTSVSSHEQWTDTGIKEPRKASITEECWDEEECSASREVGFNEAKRRILLVIRGYGADELTNVVEKKEAT